VRWDAWYSSKRWARIRRHQLLERPLCKYFLERGIVEPATVCDHIEPHHGDANKFWLGPFHCKPCHDSAKRFVETRGYRPDGGLDGWPLDPPSGQSGAVRISAAARLLRSARLSSGHVGASASLRLEGVVSADWRAARPVPLCSRNQLCQPLARVEHARLGRGRVDTNYLGNFCDRLAVIVHEVDDLAVLRRQARY
jgi:5-methylcytosine-specific restriction protein A